MHRQKFNLRESITNRIKRMTEKERAAESRSICRRVLEELDFVGAFGQMHLQNPQHDVSICLYSALPTEVDLTQLIEELLEKNVSLYFPRFESGKNVFRRVASLDELKPGSFGIMEPPITAEELPLDAPLIAIIPGRAFDRSGGRLGRGNGGYDHWIRDVRSKNSESKFLGVCFECQIVQGVPEEAHDERMDVVFTARGKM